jgi:hypothetical protein
MSARERRRKENRRGVAGAHRGRLIAAGGLTAGATLAMSGVAQAAPMTFTVGSLDDTTGAADCAMATNTDCTLRQAIIDANGNSGADTIVFSSGLTGTITLGSDPETITESLTVQGPGSSQITVDGDDTYRTFNIDPATDNEPVSISGLTMTYGDAGTGSGGAVYNDDGDLTISDSVISDSYATDQGQGGGGVYTLSGPLTVDRSTVSGNYAYYGGGIGSAYGAVTITSSTVSENYADDYGGGVWTQAADLTVRGSTLSGNDAVEDGGGIYSSFESPGGNGNPVTIENSTIAGNHAVTDDGGGIWFCCGNPGDALTIVGSTITGNTAATDTGGIQSFLYDDSPAMQNSIVSGNTSGTNAATNDVYAEPGYEFDTSFSLIGVPDTSVNDLIGNQFGVDPKLGGLQDNGGPTETMAPLCGSPAIDTGSAFSLPDDQRGLTRPVELADYPNSTAAGADGSDIGAVELQTSPGTVCAPPSPTPTPTPTPAGPTGQRTAALATCKKKHKKALQKKKAADALTQQVKKKLNKKFKKCKRKANQLPV